MYAIGRIPGRGRFRALAAAVLAVLLFAASPASAITLTAPTLSATAGDSQVTLSWTAVSGATGYQTRQSEDDGSSWGAWSNASNDALNSREATVTGLTNGTAYTFQVRATLRGWSRVVGYISHDGPASDSVTATPTATSTE